MKLKFTLCALAALIGGGGISAQNADSPSVTVTIIGTDSATITTTKTSAIGTYENWAYNYTDAVKQTLTETLSASITKIKVSGPISDDDVNAVLNNNGKRNLVTLDLSEATVTALNPISDGENYKQSGTFAVCQSGYSTLQHLSLPQLSADATSTVIPSQLFNKSIETYQTVGKLVSLVIPAGYTEIEANTFKQNEKLTSLDLSGTTLTKIGKNAFWQCTSLTSLVFPKTLERVEENAFCYHACKVLLFPENVQYLGQSAFQSSANDLSDVYFQGRTSPECADDVFGNGPYTGWGGNVSIKDKVATRENYINNGHWFTILHYRPDLTEEETLTYDDLTRHYSIKDAYLGDERLWPSQEDYTKAHGPNQADASKVGTINGYLFDGTEMSEERKKHIGILRFVLTRPDAPIPDNVVPITDNNWWTICLPYNLTKAEVKKYFGENTLLYTLGKVTRDYTNHRIQLYFTSNQMPDDNANDGGDNLLLEEGGIKAWYPYVIKPSNDFGVDAEAGKNVIRTRVPEPGSEHNQLTEATAIIDGTETEDYSSVDENKWTYVFRGSCSGMKSQTSGATGSSIHLSSAVFHRPTYCYFLGGKKVGDEYKVSFYYQNGISGKIWAPYSCTVLPRKYTSAFTDGEYADDTFIINGEQKARDNGTTFGLDGDATGIDTPEIDIITPDKAVNGNIYNLAGQLVRSAANSLEGLPAGIYVSGGKKYIVK